MTGIVQRGDEMSQLTRDIDSKDQFVERKDLGQPLPLEQPMSSSQRVPASPTMSHMSKPSRPSGLGTAQLDTVSKDNNLAVIVETVSQVKEGILKDLSRLLDDKLSGLDEVVVELIRCKSENDILKQKLKSAQEDKESLEKELARFKPVQFGFYRKM